MEEKRTARNKSTKINSVIIIIIAIGILVTMLLKNADYLYNYPQGISNLKDEVEIIEESEKIKITEEVIGKLNAKYGNNKFKVLNIEKGTRSGIDYDVIINEKYFNIDVRMMSSEHNIDFIVDYIDNKDNLIQCLESSYEQNITDRLKSINGNINIVHCNLNDYSGFLGHSGKEYMSLDTIYGRIPSQEDIDLLVHDLDIYCRYIEEVKNKEEMENFIDSVKPDIRKLYTYISQNFPRIPQGIGVTSVKFHFGNGTVLTIYPLSKHIIARQGNNTIEYNWLDIIEI